MTKYQLLKNQKGGYAIKRIRSFLCIEYSEQYRLHNLNDWTRIPHFRCMTKEDALSWYDTLLHHERYGYTVVAEDVL